MLTNILLSGLILVLIWLVLEVRRAAARPTTTVLRSKGVPRVHIEVDFNAMKDLMSPTVLADPAATKNFIDSTLSQIKQQYEAMQPGEVFVHGSAIRISTVLEPENQIAGRIPNRVSNAPVPQGA